MPSSTVNPLAPGASPFTPNVSSSAQAGAIPVAPTLPAPPAVPTQQPMPESWLLRQHPQLASFYPHLMPPQDTTPTGRPTRQATIRQQAEPQGTFVPRRKGTNG